MATRVIGRKSCITLLLCGGLFTLDASAAVEGEITPVGGPKMYNIDVANRDITNNSIGATIPYVFSLGGQYSGIASCTIQWKTGRFITLRPPRCCSRAARRGI